MCVRCIDSRGALKPAGATPLPDDLDLMIRVGFQPPEAAYPVRVERGWWVLSRPVVGAMDRRASRTFMLPLKG